MADNNNIENKIIIDIEQSSDSKAFGLNNLIHQNEFKAVKECIDARIGNAERFNDRGNEKDFVNYNYGNDTIPILGGRGVGKTSFMLSVLHAYKDDSRVEVLNPIDPTMIGEKGDIFLTLLSIIKKLVGSKIDKNNCDPTEDLNRKRNSWRTCLKSLAAGLPSMDEEKNHVQWQDSEFIMAQGLNTLSSAYNLRDNFDKFLQKSLEILGNEKKVFLVAFDDIDVDFRIGWMVLETLRKYLSLPHIITMVSGDLELFSKSVRKHQWENFGRALLKNEVDRCREQERRSKMEDYDAQVTEMESQYLQKVLKPQWRVDLNSSVDIFDENVCVTVTTAKDGKVKEKSIKNYYDEKLLDLGVYNSIQRTHFRSFLLSLPIRTQIQLLAILREDLSQQKDFSRLSEPFTSDLLAKGIDIISLKYSIGQFNIIMLDFLRKMDLLDRQYPFCTALLDQSANACVFVLSVMFSTYVQNHPELLFDYLIRIGYTRNLIFKMDNSNGQECYDELYRRSTSHGLNMRNLACNMSLYANRNTDIKKSHYRIDRNANIDIDSTSQKIAICTPLFSGVDETIFCSTHALLGNIADVIRIINEKSNDSEHIDITLSRLTHISAFNLNGLENEDDGNDGSNKNTPLIKATKRWVNVILKEKIGITPYLIDTISTTIYSFLQRDKRINNTFISTMAEAMFFQVTCIFEGILSVGIEECGKVANPGFLSKWEDFNLINKKHYGSIIFFVKWMLSCPLLLIYVKKEALERIFDTYSLSDNKTVEERVDGIKTIIEGIENDTRYKEKYLEKEKNEIKKTIEEKRALEDGIKQLKSKKRFLDNLKNKLLAIKLLEQNYAETMGEEFENTFGQIDIRVLEKFPIKLVWHEMPKPSPKNYKNDSRS